MMNKIYKLFFLVTGFFCFGQNIQTEEPTTAAFSSYIDAPPSTATGVPNTTVPLYQLNTGIKDASINIALSYHPYNSRYDIPGSEVGAGWSLFKSGVISRALVNENDEAVDWSTTNEENADVFYYSFPGHQGKFKAFRDSLSGRMEISNLTAEKIKIECFRDTGNSKFIINSFKITDDVGMQYFFEQNDLGLRRISEVSNLTTTYKTAFVLTKVLDQNNNEIITYQYDSKTKYQGNSTSIKYVYKKLNTISTRSGKLKFIYDYDAYNDTGEINENDPYSIKYITLTDPKDRVISRYEFTYSGVTQFHFGTKTTVGKRGLWILKKQNNLFLTEESTSFMYGGTGGPQMDSLPENFEKWFCPNANEDIHPINYGMGLLNRIDLPTGGAIIYNYEANEIFAEKSNLNYTDSKEMIDPQNQYYETVIRDFDSNDPTTTNFNFPVLTEPKTYISFEVDSMYVHPHGNLVPPALIVTRPGVGTMNGQPSCNNGILAYNLFSVHNYTVQITGLGRGKIVYFKLKSLPVPYKNRQIVSNGARIRNIQSFDADNNLVKSKTYEYQDFSNPLNSSGYNLLVEQQSEEEQYYTLYKNVKEIDDLSTGNNGYVKYYYNIPSDYASAENIFYNLTSAGVLDKKEVYNRQNQLVEKAQYDYVFKEIAGSTVSSSSYAWGPSKTSWVEYIKETDSTYFDSQRFFRTVSETTFSANNFKESLKKLTDAEGNVSQITTRYALDLGNTKFITANNISTPLETESRANGMFLSKIQSKYDDPASFYPTSVVNYNVLQNPETAAVFDLYDAKGNLIQATDKSGFSSTTIWGYHQTLPIAIIVGAKYSDIASAPSIIAAINASNSDDDDPATEGALLLALENLLKDPLLKNYTISSYTHNPLVGITNKISSNGLKIRYEYDSYGRLSKVKDGDGKLIKENQYNYKP